MGFAGHPRPLFCAPARGAGRQWQEGGLRRARGRVAGAVTSCVDGLLSAYAGVVPWPSDAASLRRIVELICVLNVGHRRFSQSVALLC